MGGAEGGEGVGEESRGSGGREMEGLVVNKEFPQKFLDLGLCSSLTASRSLFQNLKERPSSPSLLAAMESLPPRSIQEQTWTTRVLRSLSR